MLYKFFIKTPSLAKQFFSSYVWSFSTDQKEVYLTFDDGPHPTITPFVLEELKRYNALATFLCIGNNVELHPDVYQQILLEGHAVGNHTYDHPNGWMMSTNDYLKNVAQASKYIDSNLFRPPYGKIKSSQAKQINQYIKSPAKIIMWDVLSADFITGMSKEKCLQNVIRNYTRGSIIVFHDSEKAFRNLEYALPKTLKILSEEGYSFKKIVL
jgi:peptidoglycan/xylan/chitin deacetylase (PgdA/CDA1 family)